MPADISCIIPCFNHGSFLKHAIDSVRAVPSLKMEIIIVDDGSTDAATLTELEMWSRQEGIRVLRQQNAGPGAARNYGIANASGKYILPLDADDKVRPEYPQAAYRFLESNQNFAIAYPDFQQFGQANALVKYRDYCLQDLLLRNSIGAAAIYRRDAWQTVGGYDEALRKGLGWEDWDLWLHFAYKGFRFQYLGIVGYDYYFRADSRERTFLRDKTKVNDIIRYFEKKYPDFFSPTVLHEHLVSMVRMAPAGIFLKLFVAAFFPDYYARLVAKGKIREHLL